MAEPIREDEWLAALEAMQQRPDDPGLTCVELSELWGCSTRTALARLRQLHRTGRLTGGRKMVEGIDGRRSQVPCYRLKS